MNYKKVNNNNNETESNKIKLIDSNDDSDINKNEYENNVESNDLKSIPIKKNKEKNIFIILSITFILLMIFYVVVFNKDKFSLNIIKNDFKVLAKQYEYLLDKEEVIPEDSPIWIMWYQGINNAPPLVKACLQSVLINRAKHPVYLVDESNLNKYIELPDYILQKFYAKKFDITHFSDIVRMALLSKHGGYWIDSTYFVNTPLIHNNYSLFTLKLSECYPGTVTKCRWAGNFLGMPKRSFLSVYAYNAFLFYWKNYDKLIDYFLIDEIILVGFDNAPKLRTLIDKLPYVTCNIFRLHASLDYEIKKTDFECPFNKLNKKVNEITLYNGEKTNYGYLIDEYKLDTSNISNFNECLK